MSLRGRGAGETMKKDARQLVSCCVGTSVLEMIGSTQASRQWTDMMTNVTQRGRRKSGLPTNVYE